MTRTSTTPGFRAAHSGSAFLAATRPLGRAALTCGLAGALSLGAAGAALAGGHDAASQPAGGQGHAAAEKGSAERGSAEKGPAPKPSGHGSSTAARKPDSDRPGTSSKQAGSHQSAAPAKTEGSQQGARSHQQKPSGSRTSAPQRDHDPRGNNGTIKVDGPAWDARVDNEPHTACAFRVTFFGFDEGQTADITITGVAPTGGGVLLHDTAVPTSDDRAGGAAHDVDGATRVYTADDLGLDEVTPHPQQGYHLKVAVDSLQAPGGAKQKVLWLEPCDTTAPVTQPEVGGFEEGANGTAPGATPIPQPAATAGGTRGAATGAVWQPSAAVPAAPAALRAEAAYLEGATGSVQQASPLVAAHRPAQQAGALPASLAFTGAEGLGLLALTGAAAAAAGAGLLVARRRASAQAR